MFGRGKWSWVVTQERTPHTLRTHHHLHQADVNTEAIPAPTHPTRPHFSATLCALTTTCTRQMTPRYSSWKASNSSMRRGSSGDPLGAGMCLLGMEEWREGKVWGMWM